MRHDATQTMSDSTVKMERDHLIALARRLYVLAWVIEGIAVALGLGMALTLNLPGESTFSAFLLGGGGFVMVACAELSKIPLATFFVEASRRAKILALVFLMLMSFITFETIFLSLERGFNVRMLSVRSQAEQISILRTEHAKLTELLDNPSASFAARRAALEKQLAEAGEATRIETGSINEQRESLRRQRNASDLPKEMEAQRQALEARRALVSDERAKKVAALEDRQRTDLRVFQNQVALARNANDVERYNNAKRGMNAATARFEREKARVETDYQRESSKLEADLRDLLQERVGSLREKEQADKPVLDELAQREKDIFTSYSAKRDQLHRQLESLHRAEEGVLKETAAKQQARDDLAVQLERKEIEYRKSAAESQLHRIASSVAGWWTAKEYDPHTVPETYVRRVAVVWFGSMAALGALGGAVVAMVSQLLLRRAAKIGLPESQTRPARGATTTDRFLITLRQYLMRRYSPTRVRTVEIIKKHIEIVAVPIPVSDVPLERLKAEYAALSAPLSGLPSPKA